MDPDPAFHYGPGGGPLYDMGPYFLHALLTLLGPVRRVSGLTRTMQARRQIYSEPRRGQMIDVEVPTHVQSLLEFADGTAVSLLNSFDVMVPCTPSRSSRPSTPPPRPTASSASKPPSPAQPPCPPPPPSCSPNVDRIPGARYTH